MKKNFPFWLAIVLTGAALAASAILLIDYVKPAPVFCDGDGPCGTVKRTVFAYPLGVPMPAFGIGGFLAIALLQFVSGRRARIAQVVLSAGAALVGLGLLAVQGWMKVLCPFCAVVDTAAVLLLGVSVWRMSGGWDPPLGRVQKAGSFAAIFAAIALPLGLGLYKKPLPASLPPVIADELRKTPRGVVTVIDFLDFECPFCRMTHAEFAPLLAARKDKVRVVRKHVPLRMHPHAMDAAKAACCAERFGKGEEMTEALFRAPVDELTPEGCEALARAEGIEADRFRECLKDPAIEARIHADRDMFRAANGHGLPTIYIDAVKLEGGQERRDLEVALDRALTAL